MKKTILLALVAIIAFGTANAVPAKRTPITVTQSDGSQIMVTMVGDEWHHTLITSDGKPVERAANGDIVYRTADGISSVLAHEVVNRNANEEQFLAQNASQMTAESLIARSPRAKAKAKARAPRKVGTTQVPTIGSPHVPILVVEYKDKKCSNPIETFRQTYTSGDVSAFQYFVDQSNGKYTPQFDIYGIYALDNNRSTYGGNDSSGNDKGVCAMVAGAVDKAGNDIDWSLYDNDQDGYVDVVIVVYAGVGEAQAENVKSSVWPCQWELSDGVGYGDGSGSITRNGVTIDKFGVFNEIYGNNDSGTEMDGVGTFCHEFSHCLGLPDFYETTYSHGYYGMGNWSLMCGGCYNDDGYLPVGYNAYEKEFMGWITTLIPEQGQSYTLPVFNQKNEETDIAYKVVSPLNENECYYLENRRKTGWDRYIADQGMLVTHVSFVQSRWDDNSPNDKAVQLCTIIPADNTLSESNESGDCFGEENHELTDDSNPAATLNLLANGSIASKTGGAGLMGKPITNIQINQDKTVSFSFMENEIVTFDPVLNDVTEGDITETSFLVAWSDDTDPENVASYTLQVTKKGEAGDAELLLDEDMSLGTTTWTTSSTGIYNEKSAGYVRLGTSTANGYVMSPAVDLANSSGIATVIVRAKSYGKDSEVPMKVSLMSPDGREVASQTVTLTNTDKDYVLLLEGETGENFVKIENTVTKKRVMLKRIRVYSGDASSEVEGSDAIMKRTPTETGDKNKRTITGITEHQYNVTDLEQGATYTYKLKTIYVNGKESGWTAQKTVQLGGSGITDVNNIKDVKAVKYINMLGIESDKPFSGVNIVVTTFSDGTSQARKEVK